MPKSRDVMIWVLNTRMCVDTCNTSRHNYPPVNEQGKHRPILDDLSKNL